MARQIETHRSYFARNLNYFYVPRWSNFNTNYLPYEELLQQTTVTIVLHSPWNTEPRSQIDQIAMWGDPNYSTPNTRPRPHPRGYSDRFARTQLARSPRSAAPAYQLKLLRTALVVLQEDPHSYEILDPCNHKRS